MRIFLTLLAVVVAASTVGVEIAEAQTQPSGARPIPARTQINGQQGNSAQPPEGWAINAEQQKWVDQVLKYWEARSDKVTTFSCKFDRWEYNPHHVRDPNTPWTQASGEIKYEQPDKAVYRTTTLSYYKAGVDGQRPSYEVREDSPGEYWVCDGKSTFEFDHRSKQVNERILPVHMQGAAIAEGPLPFLFGAKAEKLKQRYWFKPLTPPKDPKTGQPIQGEYWLAAKPKTLQDARNFEVVELIIDQKEFLPKAMQIYMPGGTERKVFQFSERSVNPRQRFWQDFIKPDVPRGWKLVRDDPATAATAARNAIGQRRAQNGPQIPVPQRR